jgi:hypothetical protein
MDIFTIKIKDKKVLSLIRDLKSIGLIQIVGSSIQKPKEKLSSMMAGCITNEEANQMHNELRQMRG